MIKFKLSSENQNLKELIFIFEHDHLPILRLLIRLVMKRLI